MNKKELIAKILEKMDESDLQEILGVEDDQVSRHEIKPKKRGGGFNKKNKKIKRDGKPESKIHKTTTTKSVATTENKFEEMLKDSTLKREVDDEVSTLSEVDDSIMRDKSKRPGTLADAKCTVCGKEEKVSRSLIIGDRYRCNSCCCNAR